MCCLYHQRAAFGEVFLGPRAAWPRHSQSVIVNRSPLPVLQPPAGSALHPKQPCNLDHPRGYHVELESFLNRFAHVIILLPRNTVNGDCILKLTLSGTDNRELNDSEQKRPQQSSNHSSLEVVSQLFYSQHMIIALRWVSVLTAQLDHQHRVIKNVARNILINCWYVY